MDLSIVLLQRPISCESKLQTLHVENIEDAQLGLCFRTNIFQGPSRHMALAVNHDTDLRRLVGNLDDMFQCMVFFIPCGPLNGTLSCGAKVAAVQDKPISPLWSLFL